MEINRVVLFIFEQMSKQNLPASFNLIATMETNTKSTKGIEKMTTGAVNISWKLS